jgi:hypothetical protein
MPYEFLAKNGLISQGNITATGSLTVTQNITASNISASGTIIATSFTGSLLGTSSWATNALSASFLPVGTYNITSSWSTNALTASSLVSANSYTITNLTANNISASVYTGSSAYLSNIGFTDQTVASDTSIFPTGSTSGGLILDGGAYRNGLYRTRFVKIDRSANLSLYIQETKGSSGSFSNLVRFGTHVNSPNTFEVFGSTNIQGSITSSNFVGPLIGNTTGTASWSTNALTASSVTSTSNAFIRGGNSFGANAMLGLNDNFRLDIETNGVAVISLTGSNVGIGTTSPIDKLHVSGSITAGTNTSTFGTTILQGYYTAGSLTVLGTEQSSGGPVLGYAVTPSTSSSAAFLSSTSITIPRSAYTQDGGTHRWYIGASQTVGIGSAASLSEVMRINSSGNIGIGTTVPTGRLNIASTSQTTKAIIQSVSAATGLGGYLAFNPGGDSTYSKVAIGVYDNYFSSFNRGNIAFMINSAADATEVGFTDTKMYISASGNVGIGTTNPVATLQVAGNVSGSSFTSSISNAVGFLGTSSWAQNVVSSSYALSSSFATTAQTANALNTANSYTIAGLTVNGNISASGTISASKLRVVGTANVIELSQATAGSATYYVMDNTVETGGRRYRFGYSGASADQGSFTIYNQTDNITPFTITTSGSVGIGTTSPGEKLTVSGSSYIIGVTGAVGTGTAYYLGDSSNRDLAITRVGAAAMAIGRYYPSAWAETIRFTADGNVGIGTTLPSASLAIQSNGTQLRLQTSSGPGAYFTTMDSRYDATHPFQLAVANNSATATEFFGIYADSGGANNRIALLNGNVGIGTTTASAKLHVAGNVSGSSFTSSISNAVGFLGTSSWAQNVVSASFATTAQTANALNASNTYTIAGLTSAYVDVNGSGTIPTTGIYRPSTKTLGLSADGTLVFKISNVSAPATSSIETGNFVVQTGNVGIGTTSPAYKLDVKGNVFVANAADGNNTIAFGNIGGLGPLNGAPDNLTGSAFLVVSSSTASGAPSHMKFFTTTGGVCGERMRLAADGNVGIGSTSPAYKLDVGGTARVGDTFLITTGATADARLEVGSGRSGNGNSYLDLVGDAFYTDYGLRLIRYDTGANANSRLEHKGTGQLQLFAAEAASVTISTTSTERMRIASDGNVGIGITSPTVRLHVSGSSIITNPNPSANSAVLLVQDEGTATTVKDGTTLRVVNNGSAADYSVFEASSAASNFVILNNGNVGIGTAAPAAKLEISGSSNSALLNIKSPISGAILFVSGSGAVGINTSTVGAYTLQVNGSFAATTKSFVIEHPTKAGKKLIYGSLESPYHGIRLTGRDTLVNGKCKIQLPDYMYKLILHDSVNIQLTGIKCNKTLYIDDINVPENYFTIAYDKTVFESYKTYDFFWDFTAIRADVPELQTEM